MANEKWNHYDISRLSQGAVEMLPEVLEERGYTGKFKIHEHTLAIRSTYPVAARAFHEAEARAHKEPGHLVYIQQTTHSTLWVPESEAKTMKEAYQVALKAVENGWPADQDPTTAVGCIEDGNGFREEWELEYLLET